jgi:hypothetical protein
LNALSPEFTIPFINLTEVAHLINMKKEEKNYSKDIRMIRFHGDHFERIETEESF